MNIEQNKGIIIEEQERREFSKIVNDYLWGNSNKNPIEFIWNNLPQVPMPITRSELDMPECRYCNEMATEVILEKESPKDFGFKVQVCSEHAEIIKEKNQ